MVFLAWFLAPQILGLVFFASTLAYRKLRKRPLELMALIRRLVGSLASAMAVGLAVAAVMFLAFPRLGLLPSMGAFFFLTFASYFADPLSMIENHASPSLRGKCILSGVLAFFFVLEVFAFNGKAYSRGDMQLLSSGNSSIVLVQTPDKAHVSDAYFALGDKDTFVVYKGDEAANDFYVEMSPSWPGATIEATLSFSLDNVTYVGSASYDSSSWSHNSMVYSIPAEYASYPYVRFGISFDSSRVSTPTAMEVTDVGFNVPLAFDFSYYRMGAVAFIAFAVSGLGRIGSHYQSDKRRPDWKPYAVIGGFAAVALAVFFVAASFDVERYFIHYPLSQDELNSMWDTNIYTRLFDAFRKGQVYLDVYVDPKLSQVENPWSSSVWNQYGIEYRWDHAYWDGKYYCYYGAAPVLLVSFPIYFLTGGTLIPSLLTLQAVGMILAVSTFALLVYEIARFLSHDIHWPSLIFLFVMGLFASVFFSMMTFKEGYYHEGVYHTPIIYGQMFADLFLALSLMAYRDRKHSLYYLAGAGIAIVGVVSSRPNLALYAAFALPLYIGILADKDEKPSRKALSFLPAGLIVLLGAVGVCYYNYIRFGDILEFGQSYQMNYDQRFLTYSANKLLPSFIHFFLQSPAFYDQFPFISCGVWRLSFDDGLYFNGYYGLLLSPFFYFMVIGPFIGKKGDSSVARWFVALFLPVAFLWAFTTYSKAGICFRYVPELFHIATLGSIASYYLMMEHAESPRSRTNISKAAVATSVLSAFIGLCLAFDGFDGWLPGDLFGIPEAIKEAWWVFNV